MYNLFNLETRSSFHNSDQNGEALDLPPSEKNALILAMSYHEKGRSGTYNNETEPSYYSLIHTIYKIQLCIVINLLWSINIKWLNYELKGCP